MSLYGKKVSSSVSNLSNPFVKTGDIIYVKNRKGKFRVIEIENETITTVLNRQKEVKPQTFSWNEFAGWRSR